ncbi:MAG: hypothetical protein JRJ09_00410 [Deltaproteobacteria bacterium]|nr:hypothetical protein [Deltaproteobacteria bacterium]
MQALVYDHLQPGENDEDLFGMQVVANAFDDVDGMSRGRRKDFVDLFCLTRDTIDLSSLIALSMEENLGVRYSKLLFLKGLVDFEGGR